MDIALRKEIQNLLESKSEKYGLLNLLYPSFTLSYGFRNKFSASDYAYAAASLLENPEETKSDTECFLNASDCFNL